MTKLYAREMRERKLWGITSRDRPASALAPCVPARALQVLALHGVAEGAGAQVLNYDVASSDHLPLFDAEVRLRLEAGGERVEIHVHRKFVHVRRLALLIVALAVKDRVGLREESLGHLGG